MVNKHLKLRVLIIFMLILIPPALIFRGIDNYYSERSTAYIKQQVTSLTSKMFSDTLNEVAVTLDSQALVTYQYDNNKNITSIYINTKEINRINALANTKINNLLSSGIIEERISQIEIPLGILVSDTIFASQGPKIKISSLPINSYQVNIIVSNEEYGINNTLFQIYLTLKTDIETLVPLNKQVFSNETKILLVSQIINGSIPRYYYNGPAGESPYIPEDYLN